MSYVPVAPGGNGDVASPRLHLGLGVRRGTYRNLDVDWLRWLDAEGRVLPTGEEQARAAEEQARAAEERARAAQDEAKLLAARLAELEQRFGKLPGGEPR
ncbi:hypothetical protein [Sorangium sp. So ce385]|uniref:hypothetical protein n=1 Tax=Sorangium sp. So ce385 TaxID=3133308 RepID=UPI003F5B783D